MTVHAAKAIGAATYVSSGVKTNSLQKREESKVFDYSSGDKELVEISKETGEVGPTIKNAKKLAERQEASNPFVKRGSHDGANIYNNLDNIDWTTGQFLNLTLGQ